MADSRTYIAIDLKSFYASVECVSRGFDPLDTMLVVADASRTEKTICLAVSPPLKACGIAGRPRLFEVVRKVRDINRKRLENAPGRRFTGRSSSARELAQHPDWELAFETATPRMAHYIEVSAQIYDIYLDSIAAEDIHVYSIDEVFIDASEYLRLYGLSAHELARKLIREVLSKTGITATAGIGTNLYLCKVAMDIVAKHIPADKDGVRIAELDEMSYRRMLWNHRPLTDFWRVGRGIARRLEQYGIDTMGKLARLSLQDEELLYQQFGINAELLIDHAWGWEPCTMAAIKAYRPENDSLSSGQVLADPYTWAKARVVVKEMADAAALELERLHRVTDQVTLTIGYDASSLADPSVRARFKGETGTDYYGRAVPKHAHGTARLKRRTASARLLTEAALSIYDRTVDPLLLVRHITLVTEHVVAPDQSEKETEPVQLDLFADYEAMEQERKAEEDALEKEHRLQQTLLQLKEQYGRNAVLKGINFEEGATGRDRNLQIGGHKA
ncbi:MAG: DNA methylase [Bacteroidales bacterium]|nr:DNA methylase [Bacteroidales bacterium]